MYTILLHPLHPSHPNQGWNNKILREQLRSRRISMVFNQTPLPVKLFLLLCATQASIARANQGEARLNFYYLSTFSSAFF